MILSDKTLIAFWEWVFLPKTLKKLKFNAMLKLFNKGIVKDHFLALPDICQQAIIIDFFETEGIHIIPDVSVKLNEYFASILTNDGVVWRSVWHSNREAAIQSAILRANEFRNNL